MKLRKSLIIFCFLTIFIMISSACGSSYSEPYYPEQKTTSSTSSATNTTSSSTFMSSKSIKDILSKDNNFVFVTSRTESNVSTKAYIFSTTMTVKVAAQYIKNKRTPFETSDMNSNEKIILTYDDEYAVIYEAEDKDGKKQTIVQASDRQYLYHSRNRGLYNPFRPTYFIAYPSYYQRNLINRDTSRYGRTSTKKSTSVRTGSSNSSSTRGGGTSVGK